MRVCSSMIRVAASMPACLLMLGTLSCVSLVERWWEGSDGERRGGRGERGEVGGGEGQGGRERRNLGGGSWKERLLQDLTKRM